METILKNCSKKILIHYEGSQRGFGSALRIKSLIGYAKGEGFNVSSINYYSSKLTKVFALLVLFFLRLVLQQEHSIK